jgi:hypothetical protein
VCSIARLVLDRSALNREVYAQSLVTDHKTHGTALKAMAARATRISWVYVDALDRRPHS